MAYDESVDLEQFRAETREWLEKNCPPSMRTPMKDDEVVWGGKRETFKNPDSKIWLERMAEKGWTAPQWPKKYGGGGLNPAQARVLQQEMSRIKARQPLFSFGLWMFGPALLEFGNEEQKMRFIPDIVHGRTRWCQGYSEPGAGSDLASLQTRCEDKGDHWLINGGKLWTTNGVNGRVGILVARTFTEGCDGDLSLFIVDLEETDFEASRVGTMFIKATATSQLAFQDAKVPKENLLGPAGKGLKAILTGLNYGRLNVAAGAVGAAQRSLDLSTDYVKTRKQFGNVIGSYQLVQKLIVDMTIRTEAARALTDRAAQALDAGLPGRKECSIAKLYASEAAHEVASMALQAHGGLGYSTDYPVERLFRDTRGGLIPEGTSEIQTLIIGREVLGISAFT